MNSDQIRKYFTKRTVNGVVENLKDGFGYCCRNELSLNEYLPPNRFCHQLNQITIFISVRLSELGENAIYESIKELFGQLEIEVGKVKRGTTSDGDISILDDVGEIKTSQAKNSGTGSTHSSHKVPRYILIHYEINRDIRLELVNANNLFPELSIYLLDNIQETTKEVGKGKPKDNSSFTTFRIKNEGVKNNNVLCIGGELDSSKGKYAKIIHHRNPNI